MPVQPLEIHDVEVPVGQSSYRRPFVIVRVDGSKVAGFPLSTKIETFFNPVFDFLIPDNEPDFAATGLAGSSFVIGANEFEMDVLALKKFRGKLDGALATRFLKWYGG